MLVLVSIFVLLIFYFGMVVGIGLVKFHTQQVFSMEKGCAQHPPLTFCKVVREVLVELELPHILHSCARGSPKRQILYERVGHFQVPYLEDPNTGVEMFESAEIVDYLKATYAV